MLIIRQRFLKCIEPVCLLIFARGSVCVLGAYSQHSDNSLQICVSLYFLLAQVLQVSQSWKLKAFSGLSWAWHKSGKAQSPIQMCSFLNSPEYFRNFQSLLCTTHSSAFPFKFFWLAYCLPEVLSTVSGSHDVKQLSLIVSDKCPLKKTLFVLREVWVMSNKDSLLSRVFQGPTRLVK